MNLKRVYTACIALLVCFLIMIYKLVDIQLISTESYGPEQVNLLKESVEQRSSEIALTNGRGMFLDKNKQPINYYNAKDIVIFPFVKRLEIPSNIELKFNELRPNWKELVNKIEEPVYLSEMLDIDITNELYDQVNQAGVPGIISVERSFSEDRVLASHLLGIVRNNPEEYSNRYEFDDNQSESQPIGITGLEKAFDPFLLSDNSQKLMYHVDGRGEPLLGVNLRYQGKGDPFYPIKVQTTIDLTIQAMTERVLDEHNLHRGGVVILDIESRDILALTSHPHIDQDNPFENNSVKNEMLSIHFPGSVFKTVIAAAAIEENSNVINQSFDCNLDVYGEGQAERQLGMLSFKESFAQSCNYTFATIAKQLIQEDNQIIENYAKKLGLLGPVGWEGNVFHYEQFRQLPEEESGRVWGNEYDRSVGRAIAQTAIGQKEVKVSPLAVANMMATIAANGVNKEVRAAQSILFNNLTPMMEFTSQEHTDGIRSKTAVELHQLLTSVVMDGTGQGLKGLPVAGKSGTAQINEEDRYHHWFAGYFPIDNPAYAMVVVDLNQTTENAKTYPVFQDIVNNILTIN